MSQEMIFLSNAPFGEDLFEGKSQESIANIIVGELENNARQDHRGKCQKMIGIEGSWGSGKSNLLKLVEKKIKERNVGKFEFFLYDVWGHQEDLQRKAILNELVDFLLKKEILCKKENDTEIEEWKDKVKKTTGNVTETTQIQLPHVSWGVFLCAIILIMAPICEGIANLNFFDAHLVWRLVIASIPLILLFLLYFGWLNYNCRKAKIKNKKGLLYPTKKIFKDTFAEILSIYEDKKIKSTNREFVNEMNPSVVDFRNLLEDISKSLKDKHLVVFFDNMDRLPKEKIENLWSSIHTFFAENNGYSNISCIISFDRDHIRNAFSSIEKPEDNCGDDYIDKTFDVVFRVAFPILSDWKSFFMNRWQKAFGLVENQEEYEFVVQAYDLLSGKHGLTPRSIIKFVNESVLLKKVFLNIPDRYIAIFILKKNDLIKNSLDKTCLGNLKPIYENDDDYDKYISALVYQVPPEKALSAVYVSSLKRALDNGDKKELEKISKAIFFKDILDEAIDAVDNLDNAIVSIDMLPEESLGDIRRKKLWADLYNKAKENDPIEISINRLYGVMKESQEVLLKHVDEKLKITLIEKLIAPFARSDFKWMGSATPGNYVQLIKKFSDYIMLEKFRHILPNLSIDPIAYIDCLKKYGNILKHIPFICKSLDSYLKALNNNELIQLDCLEYLPDEMKNQLNLEQNLNNLFTQNQTYNDDYFLKVIKFFEVFPNCKMNPNLINWNSMFMFYNSTRSSLKKGIVLAIRLIHCNFSQGNLAIDTILKGLLTNDVKKSMLDYFAKHTSISQILTDEYMLKSYPVIQNYVKEHVLSGDYEITGNELINILPHIKSIRQILGIDLTPLYKKMLEYYESKKQNFKHLLEIQSASQQNIENILPIDTLEFVVQHTSEFSNELICCLITYFDSWTKDLWFSRFANQKLYGVKEALLIKYKWSQNAKDAIEKCFIEIINERMPVPRKSIDFGIMSSLDDNFKEYLFKNIRDDFRNGRAKMSLELFIFLGDWLLKYGFVQESVGNVLRTMVPSFLLDNDNAAQIIADNYDLIKSLFNKETESIDWVKKAKALANDRKIYPLKGLVE